jgi:hypothetical protein
MVAGSRRASSLAILRRSIASGEEFWMSEETEGVAEVEVEETTDPVAVAVDEAPDVAAAAEVAVEPEAVVVEVVAVEEPVADEPLVELAPVRREAQLYLCERGHRTLILWGSPPPTCNARKTRNEVCGLTLYHSTELPEQVQKALNPIKASKKKSGKK